MLFNSLAFALFLPVVVAIYYSVPHRHRVLLLLVASYYFYAAWRVEYLLIIIASTSIDYFAGRMMGRYEDRARRRPYLILSLCSNLGILFGFKYLNFFGDALQAGFQQFNVFIELPATTLLLPVGISFYTFQTLAYSIDVYRGTKKPEYRFIHFATYVAFFPQLVAGPIERSQRLLPQFDKRHEFDYERVVSGLRLMFWGLLKKVVIADRLAIYVNAVYGDPSSYQGLPIVLATYFFAFQIYCDFSGYSDLAVGTARIIGYDLMINFRQPYFAKSIGEFWRRWHISLSTWFRDYLYIPLGGNRVTKWRWHYNLLAAFVVSGLWHGAAWTFVVWGALHGLYMIGSARTSESRDHVWSWFASHWGAGWLKLEPLRSALAILTTFHLVLFGWIFFRAGSLTEALILFQNLTPMSIRHPGLSIYGFGRPWVLFSGCLIAVLGLVDLVQRRTSINRLIARQSLGVRWSLYVGAIVVFLAFGEFGSEPFIYFQF